MALTPLASGRESEGGANVFGLEARKILDDLLLRHAPGQILEDVGDGNAGPLDAGLAAANTWRDRDVLFESHGYFGGYDRPWAVCKCYRRTERHGRSSAVLGGKAPAGLGKDASITRFAISNVHPKSACGAR